MLFRTISKIAVALVFATHGNILCAQISGFGFLQDWTFNSSDPNFFPPIGEDFVEMTVGSNLVNNVWYNERQNIEEFSATFRYRVNGASFNSGYGAAFIVQNDSSGLEALGDSFFGYGFSGVDQSAGVTIELNGFNGSTEIGFNTNGIVGDGAANAAPHTPSGSGFVVSVDYNGFLLTISVLDDGLPEPFVQNFAVPSLPDIVGDTEAYVGFGAGTAGGTINQILSEVHFVSGPPIIGDVNCDGMVDLLDVAPFVSLIQSGAYMPKADINGDGELDLLDVSPFVDLLSS